jgi:hypothetical protein
MAPIIDLKRGEAIGRSLTAMRTSVRELAGLSLDARFPRALDRGNATEALSGRERAPFVGLVEALDCRNAPADPAAPPRIAPVCSDTTPPNAPLQSYASPG